MSPPLGELDIFSVFLMKLQGRGNSDFKQPGPVEALKQMLFRLQAVEAELQRQQQASVAPTLTDRLQAETPVKQV